MKVVGQGQLLRVFIGESDRWEGQLLYEAIVRAAREHGLAGATVLRGVEGYGAKSRIHTVKVLHLSDELPLIVEIVDQPELIERFLPTLEKMVTEGMVTLEDVRMQVFRREEAAVTADDGELELEDDASTSKDGRPQEFASASEAARTLIAAAKEEAIRSHRGFVDSVDVLLALICEPKGIARRVLRDLKVAQATVEKCLREQVSRETPTDQFLSLLDKKCKVEADWLGSEQIGAEHLLLALCEIRPSAATDVLTRLGAQPRDVCKEVLKVTGHRKDWQRWLADHPEM